jgi:hypothetical protein
MALAVKFYVILYDPRDGKRWNLFVFRESFCEMKSDLKQHQNLYSSISACSLSFRRSTSASPLETSSFSQDNNEYFIVNQQAVLCFNETSTKKNSLNYSDLFLHIQRSDR